MSKPAIRRRSLVLKVLVTLVCLALTGCFGPSLSEEIPGRWFEAKEDINYEFGPQGLFTQKREGASIGAGTWEVVSGDLQLTWLTGQQVGKIETWDVQRDGTDIIVPKEDDDFFFRYERADTPSKHADKATVGLWMREVKKRGQIDVMEFTPWGTTLGLIVYPSEGDKGDMVSIGVWARVIYRFTNEYALEGFKGTLPISSLHWSTYEKKGNNLEVLAVKSKFTPGNLPPKKLYKPLISEDVKKRCLHQLGKTPPDEGS